MRAVAAGLHREVGAVVQDHRNATRLRNRPDGVDRTAQRILLQ